MEQRAVSSHQTPALGIKHKTNEWLPLCGVFIYGWSLFWRANPMNHYWWWWHIDMTHPSAKDWFTFFSCQTGETVFLINPDFLWSEGPADVRWMVWEGGTLALWNTTELERAVSSYMIFLFANFALRHWLRQTDLFLFLPWMYTDSVRCTNKNLALKSYSR